MDYLIDYIGIVRIFEDELNVYFTMHHREMEDLVISVTLEYDIHEKQWSLTLLSHQFNETCPVCGHVSEQCILDEARKSLLLLYLIDFLHEHVREFTQDMENELRYYKK